MIRTMTPTRNIEELSLLYNISRTLNESPDLKTALYNVLDILSTSFGMMRGTVTILNPLRYEISIEVAHGLSRGAIERGKYKIGEGITGRVIETGESLLVPKISEEPLFLNRTATRKSETNQEFSFLCVPVKKGTQVVGALSVDRLYNEAYSLENGERLLAIIAAMIAQHVINLETIHLEQEKLRLENLRLREELSQKYRITNIVGSSSKMKEVFQMISQVSRSNATVLIRGESGTGKELVASAIHYGSARSKAPFVKVNCAALAAIRQKAGKFELANKGTIFLDEIGAISVEVQVKLLRAIQEREFERVGGTHSIKSDVRIIAATNKNLEEAVEKGEFREDLYYRLNVFPIYMPPLRERKTDIILLADYFLEKYAKENQKDIRSFSKTTIDMLMHYHWPGNVRELENCIERAVLLCEEDAIQTYHLPPSLQTVKKADLSQGASLEDAVENMERERMVDALKTTRGNMAKASNLLGVTERKFAYKAKKFGIDYRWYR